MAKSKKKGFLSASVLKLIAMAAMIIDHTSVILLNENPIWLRYIGRLAFPIFAFLIAEGAKHTSSKPRYALRLLVFAFISEIPYDFALRGEWYYPDKQNVYFTLFLGLISAIVYYELSQRKLGFLAVFSTVLFATGAMLLHSDYGFTGVVIITLMAIFSEAKDSAQYAGIGLSTLSSCVSVSYPISIMLIPQQIFALGAVIPIALYNGKKGFRINKYVFYLFYPLHLLLLALIRLLLP